MSGRHELRQYNSDSWSWCLYSSNHPNQSKAFTVSGRTPLEEKEDELGPGTILEVQRN